MPFRHPAKILALSLIFSCFACNAFSQKLVNTSGATISSNGFVIEYSVGEIAVTALLGPNNYVSQGLLQPNVKVANAGCDYINQDFGYFPNPARTTIGLVGVYNWIDSYMIYAADGRLVGQAIFNNNTIDVTKLAAGAYFIQLFPGCNGKYKTLKILKQ